MRPVLGAARPYLPRLVGAGLLAAAADAAGLALLATATWLLVTAAGQPPLAALTVAIVAVRALAIGRGTLRYAERLTGHDAVLRVLAEVRTRVFAALARDHPGPGAVPGTPSGSGGVPGGDPVAGRSGDLLSRVVSDVEAGQDLLLRVLVPGAAAAAAGAGTLVAAALIVPAAAPVLAAGLLVAGVLLPVLAVRALDRTAAVVAPLRAEVAAGSVDLAHGAADLAAFGATRTAVARCRDSAGRLARAEARLATTRVALDAAGTLVAGGTAAAVAVVALRAGAGGAAVAVVTVGSLLAVEVTLTLLASARHWAGIRVPLARVGALLAAPAAGAAGTRTTGYRPVPAGPVAVAARGLWMRYRAAGAGRLPALAGVDLDLPPGRRVAVVGPSGAGKSTLLAVLAGLRPADAGTVTVAGAPLADYHPGQRHRLVGGLLADAHVFHATVRDNLLLGRPETTPEELAAAVEAAGLGEWVRGQPDGLDTVVGEDGGQLSGGQRQRLALARALLAGPAVLLLDEPTEGLAAPDARQVLSSVLAAAGPHRAVLLVTHHLRGLAGMAGTGYDQTGFDEIVVLDAGRVVQRGRHRELVAAEGWYRDQYLAQQLTGAA